MQGRLPGIVLIGREADVRRISELVRSGRGALLVGEAGIGKTSLLDAVVRYETLRCRRITASTADGSLPLGAFMSVGDEEWRAATVTGIAARLRNRLLHEGTRMLTVDDAHLLDAASAGLVLELARSGVVVVAAARSGSRLPAALDALVRDQWAERTEVGEIPERAIAPLIAAVLGGPVSPTLAAAIALRCRGHPLHIREVAERLAATGAVERHDGRWRLTGPMPLLDRVSDLIAARLTELSSGTRGALETVAVADGLDLAALARLHDHAAIAAAEEAGVLRVVNGTVMPGHPLYRDATLQLLPAMRRREILTALVDERAGRSEIRDADRVRLAEWRMRAGIAQPAAELLTAAELVFDSAPALCAALVDAAEPVAGPADEVRLAAMLVNLQQPGRADPWLDRAERRGPPSEAMIRVVALRAFGASMMDHRPSESLSILTKAIDRFGAHPMLEAQRATTLWRLGRTAEAETVALAVLQDQRAEPDARAAAGAAVNGIRCLQVAEVPFDAGVGVVEEILAGGVHPLAGGVGTLAVTRVSRRAVFQQDVVWGRDRLSGLITEALIRGAESEAAQYSWMLGWNLVLRGRAQTGAALIEEGSAATGPWQSIASGWVQSRLIRALVAAGRADEARQRLDTTLRRGLPPIFDSDLLLAEAAVLAGEGDPSAARRAMDAVDAGVRAGTELAAVEAAFTAALLGHADAAHVLTQLLGTPVTDLQRVQLGWAGAVLAEDPDSAVDVAVGLRALGHTWASVEVLQATARMGTAGRRQLPRIRAMLHTLARETEPLVTLTAAPTVRGARLTPREAAVARLVADGLADREIAERLGISVRTVESHVARVYAKTGIHDRVELAEALRL